MKTGPVPLSEFSGCAVVDIDLVAEAGPQADPFDLGGQLAGLFELQLEPHREHRFAVEKQLHRPTVNQVDVEDVVLRTLRHGELGAGGIGAIGGVGGRGWPHYDNCRCTRLGATRLSRGAAKEREQATCHGSPLGNQPLAAYSGLWGWRWQGAVCWARCWPSSPRRCRSGLAIAAKGARSRAIAWATGERRR